MGPNLPSKPCSLPVSLRDEVLGLLADSAVGLVPCWEMMVAAASPKVAWWAVLVEELQVVASGIGVLVLVLALRLGGARQPVPEAEALLLLLVMMVASLVVGIIGVLSAKCAS